MFAAGFGQNNQTGSEKNLNVNFNGNFGQPK